MNLAQSAQLSPFCRSQARVHSTMSPSTKTCSISRPESLGTDSFPVATIFWTSSIELRRASTPGGRNGLCCLQSGAKRFLASFDFPELTKRRNSSATFLWSYAFMRVIQNLPLINSDSHLPGDFTDRTHKGCRPLANNRIITAARHKHAQLRPSRPAHLTHDPAQDENTSKGA